MWRKHRILTDEEWRLLTRDEVNYFNLRAFEASKFEGTFLFAISCAGIMSIVALILGATTLAIIGGVCFIGFVIVAWVGIDVQRSQFNRLLFDAVDRHKNGM